MKILIVLSVFNYITQCYSGICNINQYFCSSVNDCVDNNISCIDKCDLCIRRQQNGENIACINDCQHDTRHLVGNCRNHNCQDKLVCPEGFLLEKHQCECKCVVSNLQCSSQALLCPKITQLSIPNDNIGGYSVYELSLILKPEAYNVYALYGDSENNMIIPAAYQVHQHLGANLGGINPVLINYIHDSIFDSWFTISITDGDDMEYINSIGIGWNQWTQDNGLIIDNGAIFINDPVLKLSDTNEYIIAHLTVDDRRSHLLRLNVNGKISRLNTEPQDLDNYQSVNVEFNIPRKIPNND